MERKKKLVDESELSSYYTGGSTCYVGMDHKTLTFPRSTYLLRPGDYDIVNSVLLSKYLKLLISI